jgi:hypothetical protein
MGRAAKTNEEDKGMADVTRTDLTQMSQDQ